MPRKKTHDEYIAELASRHPNIECLGTYMNESTKILHRCKVCGYERLAAPGSVLASKSGCPKCSGNLPYTTETFAAALSKEMPSIIVLGEYTNANTKLLVQCAVCGTRWEAKPAALLNKHGCPSCMFNQTSYFEQLIRWTLSAFYGKDSVISRDKTAIGRELDIYLPTEHLAIEPGSWKYGHRNKLGSDMKKRELCVKHGIRLITVYDSYPAGTVAPFPNDCLTYTRDLGQAGREAQQAAIGDLLGLISVYWRPSDEQCGEIEQAARQSCGRKSHDAFEKELSLSNPDVLLLGRYTHAHENVLVRCKICGHEWEVDPYSITHGSGCPVCGRKTAAKARTRTSEQFAEIVASDNPSIKLLEPYRKGSERIKVECRKCGHIWTPKAYSLIGPHHRGCPHCKAVKAGRVARGMTREQFVGKLAAQNPSVELVGEYAASKTKTTFKCLTCGNTWEARPYSVLQGHGCPMWRIHPQPSVDNSPRSSDV